jgi:NAD(P)-dependent dehydrogenase (short-subunit alcohol dehydrogenase family)
MDLGLENKVAIITGASRGIGLAIAERLAAEGMRLVLAARSADLLQALAERLPSDCLAYPLDLREPQSPAGLVAAAITRFERLDVLVNNAGATQRGNFLTLPDETWADGFALKFFGAMRTCRAAWPHLRASQGAIINIAGIGGRTGSAEFTIGGSVNAALLNLTKSLADLGVREGVRVNAINPGSIATDRLQPRIERFAAEQKLDHSQAARLMAEKMGIARFGQPGEIASAVAFLASPLAAYCQGMIVDIDGGQTRTL